MQAGASAHAGRRRHRRHAVHFVQCVRHIVRRLVIPVLWPPLQATGSTKLGYPLTVHVYVAVTCLLDGAKCILLGCWLHRCC